MLHLMDVQMVIQHYMVMKCKIARQVSCHRINMIWNSDFPWWSDQLKQFIDISLNLLSKIMFLGIFGSLLFKANMTVERVIFQG